MNPLSAPAWAEVYGDDDFDIFAEFTLKAVRFAWRWIPPGRFLMGSPTTDESADRVVRGGSWGPLGAAVLLTASTPAWASSGTTRACACPQVRSQCDFRRSRLERSDVLCRRGGAVAEGRSPPAHQVGHGVHLFCSVCLRVACHTLLEHQVGQRVHL